MLFLLSWPPAWPWPWVQRPESCRDAGGRAADPNRGVQRSTSATPSVILVSPTSTDPPGNVVDMACEDEDHADHESTSHRPQDRPDFSAAWPLKLVSCDLSNDLGPMTELLREPAQPALPVR